MNTVKKIENLVPSLDMESVFRLMHCTKDSPVYEEMVEAYNEIKDEAVSLCKPQGVIAIGKIPSGYGSEEEREAIFLLSTIGNAISKRSTRAFTEGEYVHGLMIDAMADVLLFSMEEQTQLALKQFCAEHKKGIAKRIEPPHDLPMEINKIIFDTTHAAKLCNMRLSSGYMFEPLKTNPQIYLTTDDCKLFQSAHNCRTCPNKTCFMRHVEPLKVKVIAEEETFEFHMKDEAPLLSGLQQAGRKVIAPCGGNGRCGKCKVQVVEGELPITTQDRAILSQEELECGFRLACEAIPTDHLTIRLGWKSEQNMMVQAEFAGKSDATFQAVIEEEREGQMQVHRQTGYGIAIDIGTTTIATQLADLSNGQILGTQTGLNHQRAYGADVISRIFAATQGKEPAMTSSIRKDISNLMERLCTENFVKIEQIEKIVIAGNTTMIHLLMGYPCEGLGKVPFTPYEIKTINIKAQDLFIDDRLKANVWICPGISTFVGADITSGICALEMEKSKEICLLVDLGTNGEMALGNKEKLLVTSTAAGPAFEGGNITCGIGSIPGAICNADFELNKLVIKTIQDKNPLGICGTGVIEIIAALVKENVIDETGLLDDRWFEDGYPVAIGENGAHIVLTQDDIREIQLAKAAVRGGIETLLHRYGITAEQVDCVYIAGGFGYALDCEKAVQIGMFPSEFSSKVKAVGNSSLGGAVKMLLNEGALADAEKIASLAKEVELSSDATFQTAYIDAMYFEV